MNAAGQPSNLVSLGEGQTTVVDDAGVIGPGYPSEIFHALQKSETARYGGYRTAKLLLQAWDTQEHK